MEPTYRAVLAETIARPHPQTSSQSPSLVCRRRAAAFCTARRQVQAPVRPFPAVLDCSRRRRGNESTARQTYPFIAFFAGSCPYSYQILSFSLLLSTRVHH